MRCKRHITDLSSNVGVCASCLRERLFSIIAAQEDRRKSDPQHHHPPPQQQPPPPVFPRSVSPYVCRRKSDFHHHHQHQHSLSDQRFYHTPQVGPTGGVISGESCKNKKSRFSLLSRLFRSRSRKTNSDPDPEPRVSAPNSYAEPSSSSSPSWFSVMLSGHRKKQSRLFCMDESSQSSAVFGRRLGRNRDRGMSPARVSDYGNETEFDDGSSCYTSARQTPMRAAPTARGGAGRLSHSRNGSGLKLCLSPLVRASPNNHRNQKGAPPETAFSGDIRVKPHLSTAASYCANRSRKLADFGRFSHNH